MYTYTHIHIYTLLTDSTCRPSQTRKYSGSLSMMPFCGPYPDTYTVPRTTPEAGLLPWALLLQGRRASAASCLVRLHSHLQPQLRPLALRLWQPLSHPLLAGTEGRGGILNFLLETFFFFWSIQAYAPLFYRDFNGTLFLLFCFVFFFLKSAFSPWGWNLYLMWLG